VRSTRSQTQSSPPAKRFSRRRRVESEHASCKSAVADSAERVEEESAETGIYMVYHI
jgi:hypothetical protein